MKKNSLILSFFLVGLTAITSCKKDKESTTNPQSDCVNTSLWLKDGHKFSYKNYPILISGDSLFIEIKEVSPNIFQSITKTSLYSISSEFIQPCGNIMYQSNVQSMDNKQIGFKLDGDINESWVTEAKSALGTQVSAITTILEKNVTITVPAGTFVCTKSATVIAGNSTSVPTVTQNQYINNKYGIIKVMGYSGTYLYNHYELAKVNY